MKYAKYLTAVLFAGLLKVNAQDCDTVKNILRTYYQIDDSVSCCNYAVNDKFAVSCNGDAVTSLAIVNNPGITEVPADVASLANLESLDISNCHIQKFPSNLNALPKLKNLVLSKNAIGEIPEDIGTFPALEKLDVSENGLTALPVSIGNLANLKNLNVYRNFITALPDSVAQLSLQRINIGGNQDLAGSLKKFSSTPELCDLRNTHICIEEKGVCSKYIVNNQRMPYCHPENFSEEELDAGFDGNTAESTTGSTGGGKSSGSKKKTIYIVCGIIAGVLLLAAIGYFLMGSGKKSNDKMGQNARLENNYGRNPDYQQMNQHPQQYNPNYQQNYGQNYGQNMRDADNRRSGSTVGTDPNSYSVDIKPLVKH